MWKEQNPQNICGNWKGWNSSIKPLILFNGKNLINSKGTFDFPQNWLYFANTGISVLPIVNINECKYTKDST